MDTVSRDLMTTTAIVVPIMSLATWGWLGLAAALGPVYGLIFAFGWWSRAREDEWS